MAMPEAAAAAMAAAVATFTRRENAAIRVLAASISRPSRPKPRDASFAHAFQFGPDLAAADHRKPDADPLLGHLILRSVSLSRRTITASISGSSSAAATAGTPSAAAIASAAPMSQPITAPGITRSWPPSRPTRSQTCQPSYVSGRFSRAGQSGHGFAALAGAHRAVAVAPAEVPVGEGAETFFSASSSRPFAT